MKSPTLTQNQSPTTADHTMNNYLIPFDGSAKLPAYLSNRSAVASAINADIIGSGPSFPVLSIKGKVFTLVKGTEKKVLTKADDPDEVLQSINLAVVRANTKSRVFYAKAYTEGESDGAKPTCFSSDGVAPDSNATEPQAKKCQGCPQNVWGVRDGKGTACSTNTRLAVVDPSRTDEPFLLRVPPASRKGFADAVRMASTRNLDYNMLVIKVGFDKEAPSPKLTFKPVGLLSDGIYAEVNAMFEDDVVKDILGLRDAAPAGDTSNSDLDELDAAIAAKSVVAQASAPKPKALPAPAPVAQDEDDEPAPAPAPKPKAKPAPAPVELVEDDEPAPAPAPKPKAKPAPAADDTDLLADLDALLSATDD